MIRLMVIKWSEVYSFMSILFPCLSHILFFLLLSHSRKRTIQNVGQLLLSSLSIIHSVDSACQNMTEFLVPDKTAA